MSEPGNQLRSWKDIAAFLDAHERTVRPWVRTRQLPVHRVGGRERDAVFANVNELEAWIAAGKNVRSDQEPCNALGDLQAIDHVSGTEGASVPGVPTVRVRSHARIRQTWMGRKSGTLTPDGRYGLALRLSDLREAAPAGASAGSLLGLKGVPDVHPNRPPGHEERQLQPRDEHCACADDVVCGIARAHPV
jgi:hypothetical protein